MKFWALHGTTGFAKGNYTISAYAWPVPDETDLKDNTYTDGWVIVAMVGDIDGNGKVEIKDIALVAKWFGRIVPPAPANCDLDNNGNIDVKDIAIVCKNFGKIDP